MTQSPLILDKISLPIVQKAARLVAFKRGVRHFLVAYPDERNWNVTIELDLAGLVSGGGTSGTDDRHHAHPERGECAASLNHEARDLFKLLRLGDQLTLEWWPDCNSPWLDANGLTRDLLRLIVRRKKGKALQRLELVLADEITGQDNASIRMCKGFPYQRRTAA